MIAGEGTYACIVHTISEDAGAKLLLHKICFIIDIIKLIIPNQITFSELIELQDKKHSEHLAFVTDKRSVLIVSRIMTLYDVIGGEWSREYDKNSLLNQNY